MRKIAIIGGGPAGLRVAEMLSKAGECVHLYERMRSVGRKFLVAGKSGLNLTNDAEREDFLSKYKGEDLPNELWGELYDQFDKNALRQWAMSLGQETFVSSGKKVFPESMKAAPLLRAWVQSIKAEGGEIFVKHSLVDVRQANGGYALQFSTDEGTKEMHYTHVVFAMGGGSWPKTGSDGSWVNTLTKLEVPVSPLCGANCGWEVDWSSRMLSDAEGLPVKNVVCSVGDESLQGEFVITRYGLEGGPIYRLGYALRQMDAPYLTVDLKPSFTADQLYKKVESVRGALEESLQKRWKLSPASIALLTFLCPEHFQEKRITEEGLRVLSAQVKELKIQLIKPRAIEEAISSAGGVMWSGLDDTLMLKSSPNVYTCGEMVDWEAPTGGFLLQGCFLSATRVAHAILEQR